MPVDVIEPPVKKPAKKKERSAFERGMKVKYIRKIDVDEWCSFFIQANFPETNKIKIRNIGDYIQHQLPLGSIGMFVDPGQILPKGTIAVEFTVGGQSCPTPFSPMQALLCLEPCEDPAT